MWLRRLSLLIGIFAALGMSCTGVASAGEGWQWPLEGSPLLGFGATYQALDGATNVHGGLDIAGASGARVRACASGEVVFAGRVPAGEGAQAFAVTILTGDGLRVTLLPLSSAAVSAGSQVAAGDAVGALASTGDASSGPSHLHLGVKRGSTRLDPATFLSAGAPAPAPAPSPEPAAVPRASGIPTTGRPHPAAGAAPVHATAPVAGGASMPAIDVSQAPATAREAFASAPDAMVSALEAVPRLRRIPLLKTTHTLSMSRIWQDVADLRGTLGRAVLTAALVLVAAGCLTAVVRTAATGAQRGGAALAPAREERS